MTQPDSPDKSAELAIRDSIVEFDERDFVKAVAMDIGKEVAHHIETMYPEAVKAASSTLLLSVRNTTYNALMGWLETGGTDTATRLKFHAQHRRYIKAQYKKIREREGAP